MNDDRIIELYFSRNEAAITETANAYGHYFSYIAYGILHNDQDCEEIVNDTYNKAWNTIPPQRPYNLKAFLGRITRQLSINRLEERGAQKRAGSEYSLALEELSEILSDPNGDSVADTLALSDALNRFLQMLSQDSRRVFIRRYWHMYSISEIANDLSFSESRVKSMLMRSRGKLKIFLKKEGFDV